MNIPDCRTGMSDRIRLTMSWYAIWVGGRVGSSPGYGRTTSIASTAVGGIGWCVRAGSVRSRSRPSGTCVGSGRIRGSASARGPSALPSLGGSPGPVADCRRAGMVSRHASRRRGRELRRAARVCHSVSLWAARMWVSPDGCGSAWSPDRAPRVSAAVASRRRCRGRRLCARRSLSPEVCAVASDSAPSRARSRTP